MLALLTDNLASHLTKKPKAAKKDSKRQTTDENGNKRKRVKCEPSWSDVIVPLPKKHTNVKKKVPKVKCEPLWATVTSPVVRPYKLNLPVKKQTRVKKERAESTVVRKALVKIRRFDAGLSEEMKRGSLFLCPICDDPLVKRAELKPHLDQVHKLPKNFVLAPVEVGLTKPGRMCRRRRSGGNRSMPIF